MKSFFSMLEERVHSINSLLCIGLDPHPIDLLEQTAGAARNFCLRLIEATADVAAAFKPNAAFFEALGASGWEALTEVITAVPDGIPVILDAKRGDISSTAEAYRISAFEKLGANAITLNPYLGFDSLQPFLEDPTRGVFLLCKTSNPSAVDLQELPLAGEDQSLRLYEKVALLAQTWNSNNNLGVVVGATNTTALERVRNLAPDLWILAPGVGAQGGDLNAALQAGLRSDGLGMLVPVSRTLSRATDPRQAALELHQTIKTCQETMRENVQISQFKELKASSVLVEGLLEADCFRFGQFTLKSGIQSPIYIDLRKLASYPDLLSTVAAAYIPVLRRLEFNRLAALPYAALPIATAISLQTGWPMIYPRKEIKTYGMRAPIEGNFQPGEEVVVIDDLATTGGSIIEAIEKLTTVGLRVNDVVVLIDRQSGAPEALNKVGYHLHSILSMTNLLDYLEGIQRISSSQIKAVRRFLEDQ